MKIGIVNDVALAREALRRVVASVPDLEVAWLARDGAEAVELVRSDPPDLVLMDLFMPRLDGVEATRQIMAARPCAILVVTATVSGHIHKVYEAMGYGALDAVDTPTLGARGDVEGAAALLAKITTVAKVLGTPLDTGRPSAMITLSPRSDVAPSVSGRLVLLGASTGGPGALKQILGGLPATLGACVLVVQHVDAAFAPGLATWLGEGSRLPVELVREGDRPKPNRVLLAGTNEHLVLDASGRLCITPEPRELSFRPSVDVFFKSVAEHATEPGVAVLLTGMGRDGARGLRRLRDRGWYTIAQDQATSVVWGMPRAAVEGGAAVDVLPVEHIAPAITDRLSKETKG